jgi:hypothetical protein
VLVRLWRERVGLDGGPFGGFGDPPDAAAQGTPRNGPSALHNVLRWRSTELLRLAEAAVLQQTLRPTPGTRPRRPDDTEAWRQGLSQRAEERPHGFTALDYEHFSVDLLYDLYWLTGDPLARAELVRAGSGLRPLLEGLPFRTARGEGWCLQGGALIARATGDREIVEWLLTRFRREVLPELGGGTGEPWAIAQPPHTDALGPGDRFDAPWQMAALVHGLHALWSETGASDVRDALLRVARTMATDGWVPDVGPKYLYATRAPDRYRMPVGHGPLEGTAWMEIGAFVLAAEAAVTESDRRLFESRADFVVGGSTGVSAAAGGGIASTWFQLYFDRKPPRSR